LFLAGLRRGFRGGHGSHSRHALRRVTRAGRTATRFSFVYELGSLAECQRSPVHKPRSTGGSPPTTPEIRI
jgi:hypothetical protein